MIMWRVTHGQTDMVLYIYRWHSNSHVGWTESNDIMMWSVSCVVSEEGDAPTTEGESCLEIMQIPNWTFGLILSSFTAKIVPNLENKYNAFLHTNIADHNADFPPLMRRVVSGSGGTPGDCLCLECFQDTRTLRCGTYLILTTQAHLRGCQIN